MKTSILFLISLLATFPSWSQIGIGTTNPNPSAVVEIKHTSKGLLLPRIALVDTINAAPLPSHVSGMMVYNTTDNAALDPGVYINNGIRWKEAGSGGSAAVVAKPISQILSAEYEGAVLDSTGTNGANVGCLRVENVGAANNYRNAYVWETTETIDQTYKIVLRYAVPDDYASVQTNWLTLDYKMGAASGNALTLNVMKEDGTVVLATQTPANSTSWSTQTVSTAPINAITASDVLIITLTLTANNTTNANMSVGDINFNYQQ